MKERLVALLATATAVAATWVAMAQLTTALTWSVSFTGTPTSDDVRAAMWAVANENAARLATNGVALATNTGPVLKASYQTVLSRIVTDAHVSYIKQSVSLTEIQSIIPQDKIDQMRARILDRLKAGESADSIITDLGN